MSFFKLSPEINNVNKDSRVFYLDFLRILACIAVILIHTSAQNWYITDVRTIEWKIMHAYDCLGSWAVPLFVMISGCLHLSKANITMNTILKKIFRLLFAYLFWCVIYAFFTAPFLSRFYGWQAYFDIFFNRHYHLWYIFMLVALYLTIPILKVIVDNKNALNLFLILSLVFSFFLPTFYSAYIGLPDFVPFTWLKTLIVLSKRFYDDMNFHLTLGYTCYFVLGFVLYKYNIPKKYRIVFYILAILSCLFRIVTSLVKSHNLGRPAGYDYSLNIFIEVTAIFLFAKYFVNKCTSKKVIILVEKIAPLTFGIYLVHALVLEDLRHFWGINTLSASPIIMIPVIIMMVFIISSVIIFFMRKIPVIKNCC